MTRFSAACTIALLLLAACDRRAPQADVPVDASPATVGVAGGRAPADGTARPLPTDAWLGRWTGPEGLFLDIAAGGERGRYAMTIKGDLDSAGDHVAGIADGASIRFVRRGAAETLRGGDGAATGLKWLADKHDCLIVRPGEGFCRD